MSFDRATNNVVRIRRAWQRINLGGFTYGDGVNFDVASQTVSLDLASAGGLEFSSSQLQINLDANPGLALSATGLIVLLNGTSLTLGASGLSVTAPEGKYSVTAIKTANYNAAIGEAVRCDASGGGFAVTLPTAVGVSGRIIVVKPVVLSLANTVTVNTTGGQTIDGAASVGLLNTLVAQRYMSDNSNWMVV